jgi:hypothetical protein
MTGSEKNPKEKQPDRGEERDKRETGKGEKKKKHEEKSKGKRTRNESGSSDGPLFQEIGAL